jgi:hypothetical protein
MITGPPRRAVSTGVPDRQIVPPDTISVNGSLAESTLSDRARLNPCAELVSPPVREGSRGLEVSIEKQRARLDRLPELLPVNGSRCQPRSPPLNMPVAPQRVDQPRRRANADVDGLVVVPADRVEEVLATPSRVAEGSEALPIHVRPDRELRLVELDWVRRELSLATVELSVEIDTEVQVVWGRARLRLPQTGGPPQAAQHAIHRQAGALYGHQPGSTTPKAGASTSTTASQGGALLLGRGHDLRPRPVLCNRIRDTMALASVLSCVVVHTPQVG